MKINKKIISLVGVTALLCLACFLPNIINNLPLTYGTDLKPQQYFFIKETYRMYNQLFTQRTLPFFSWNLFLGTNFYAAMSFYGNADIFTILGYFLKDMNFFDLEMLLTCLKMFVASFSMYGLLTKYEFEHKIKLLGAVCFAFSSWAIFFSGQLMFFSFYSLMPLYFLGMESYLKEKKILIFSISTILLLFTNWYFFYTISFFSPIYFIYRYYNIHKSFKGFLKNTSILVVFYLLSIGVTLIYFFPTIRYLSGNNRVGGLTGLLFFDEIQTYLHMIASMFAPNALYIYGNNVFETRWHVTREICMWAGSLSSLCVFISLTNKDKKERFAQFFLCGFFLLILIFPNGNAMMHGFSESSFRWTMLIIFMNIITMCQVLTNINKYDFKKIKIISYLLALFCILIVPFTALLLRLPIFDYIPQTFLFVSSSILIITHGYLLTNKKSLIKISIFITILELVLFNSTLYIIKLDTSPYGTYQFNESVMHVLQDDEGDLREYLNLLDPNNYYQYYRVYIPKETVCWNYSPNCSVEYGVNGLMTYSSTISPHLNKLIEIDPSITAKERSSLIMDIEHKDTLTFLNTKYALVLSENELPKGMNWTLIEDNYRGSVQIYENLNYRPLITSYTAVKNFSEFVSLDELLTTVFTENEIEKEEIQSLMTTSDVSLGELTYSSNQLITSLTSQDGGFVVLTLPYDESWKILVNGQEVQKFNVNGGFIGFGVPSGDVDLEMYFTPSGFKQGAIISAISFVLLTIISIFFQLTKRRNH